MGSSSVQKPVKLTDMTQNKDNKRDKGPQDNNESPAQAGKYYRS